MLQGQETLIPMMIGNHEDSPRNKGVFGTRMNPPPQRSIRSSSLNVGHHSSPSSVLTFPPRCPPTSTNYMNMFDTSYSHRASSNTNSLVHSGDEAANPPISSDLGSHEGGGCMLFGFSLMEADKVEAANSVLPGAPAVSKTNDFTIVSDCTHSVRGTVFDVAL